MPMDRKDYDEFGIGYHMMRDAILMAPNNRMFVVKVPMISTEGKQRNPSGYAADRPAHGLPYWAKPDRIDWKGEIFVAIHWDGNYYYEESLIPNSIYKLKDSDIVALSVGVDTRAES